MQKYDSGESKQRGTLHIARKYLFLIFLIVALTVLSVFSGFSYQTTELIHKQLHIQGQALLREIILTRQWAANHGGVYVKAAPGMAVNPHLAKIPGLKLSITDQDEKYILKVPSVITREISELAAEKGIFRFRITSLKPLNPANTPDEFETAALKKFEQGAAEFFAYEEAGGETMFRLVTPLVTEKTCLQCHAAQGYREGDIRGGISVSIPATDLLEQLRQHRFLLFSAAVGIVALIFTLLQFVSHAFMKQLQEAEVKLTRMALSDFLTGLYNRREMYHRLAKEASRSGREGTPLSVIMIDIDRFKYLNDTFGHALGDSVIKGFAQKLQESLREYDIPCRYGGEEFLVVTPNTSLECAKALAERLRVMTLALVIPGGAESLPVSFTISAGVAQLAEGEDVDSMICRADTALYRAKKTGRNRVEVDDSEAVTAEAACNEGELPPDA